MMMNTPPGGSTAVGLGGGNGIGGSSIGIGAVSSSTSSSSPSMFLLNNVSGGALDSFPNLVSKRAATWRYLQKVYQGGMVLYNTSLLSDEDLRHNYMDEKMQRRALQYFLLGTSLATILEIPNTNDCLKALHRVIQEYEYFTASESKAKMVYERLGIQGSHDLCVNLTHLEMFQKIDSRFKKILLIVSKELEAIAREVMMDELSLINPLGPWSSDDWDP
ncbi:hypothetical protein BGZ83_007037 [Gryganskiella cystojenkinii]|nr:hypothetical protein BGZ83_007037 [Gryganskiella cystojenkinii]